jgi:ribosomal-protein-alanine N-acetyltransferase
MGSQLLTAMLERARVEGCHEMLLEVRASNTPARKLYEKHGFREAGLRRGYYGNPTEDAVLLKLEIPKAALENA